MTTITVTAEHIARGDRKTCSTCPIALAFDAAIPEAVNLSVTWGYASVWLDLGKAVTYVLPPAAREFIEHFDGGLPVSPFTFEAQVQA